LPALPDQLWVLATSLFRLVGFELACEIPVAIGFIDMRHRRRVCADALVMAGGEHSIGDSQRGQLGDGVYRSNELLTPFSVHGSRIGGVGKPIMHCIKWPCDHVGDRFNMA
jgi:hypothetical protein